jgi:hypothetical protein
MPWVLAATGSFAFYPASKLMTYTAFLVALFAIAAGCSILKTSANPYVISLGPEANATRRPILLSIVGVKGWSGIASDRFNWSGPEVQKALEQLGQILDYADAAASLTWDEAAKQLASGKCAFLSMNDSPAGALRRCRFSLGQTDDDGLGSGPHCARLGRPDEAPWIQEVRGTRRRLGRDGLQNETCDAKSQDPTFRRLGRGS